MECFVLLAVTIVINSLIMGYIDIEHKLLKDFILGITNFLFGYVLVSAALLVFECFTVKKTVGIIFLISLVFFLILLIRSRRIPKFVVSLKEVVICLIVLLCVLPVTIQKYDFYGMGQDQGVYQTKAIELMYENSQRIFNFEEYDKLENEDDKVIYYDMIRKSAGYDLISNCGIESINTKTEKSPLAGIYHGIPTFPSLLALSAKIFGLSQMQQCQTIFLILLLLTLFCILENLNIPSFLEGICILILGLSPQTIWVSKSALTELFLALIIAIFIFAWTEKNRYMQHYSWISIVLFSFFHVTIYTMMPMFVFIYWFAYLWKKEKRNLIYCNLSVVGYYIGFIFMLYIAPTYTSNNYVFQLERFWVNYNNLVPIVSAGCLGVVIVNLFLMHLRQLNCTINKGQVVFRRYIKIGLLIYLFLFIIMCFRNEEIVFSNLGMVQLIGYAIMSGGVILPFVLFKLLFLNKYKTEINFTFSFLMIIFSYTILFYSLFLRKTVLHYYYYGGRYMVPYLISILAFFAYLSKESRSKQIALMGIMAACVFGRYDKVLIEQKDDSRIEWNVLEEVLEHISPNTKNAIYISEELKYAFVFPLKAAGNDIYFTGEPLSNYDKVYYITSNEEEPQIDVDIEYRAVNQRNEDALNSVEEITKLPLGFFRDNKIITLYEVKI